MNEDPAVRLRKRIYSGVGVLVFVIVVLVAITSLQSNATGNRKKQIKIVPYIPPSPPQPSKLPATPLPYSSACDSFITSRLRGGKDTNFNNYITSLFKDQNLAPKIPPATPGDTIVNVGVVSINEGVLDAFYSSIGSLLFHSSKSVHLHIFADSVTKPIMAAWYEEQKGSFPQPVFVSYYDMDVIRKELDFASKDKFRDGNTGTLLKAYPDLVLPGTVDRIIFTDTDTIWVKDIYELWQVLDTMKPEQLFAMTPAFSTWYSEKGGKNITFPPEETGLPTTRWGLNAGLLVLNVAGMRKYGWTKRWEAEVTERLTLGDSDAYNGMASRHRELFKLLPWGWNIQVWPYVREKKQIAEFEIENVGMLHGLSNTWTHTIFRSLWDLYHPKLLKEAKTEGCDKYVTFLREQGRTLATWLLNQNKW